MVQLWIKSSKLQGQLSETIKSYHHKLKECPDTLKLILLKAVWKKKNEAKYTKKGKTGTCVYQ